MKSKMKKVMKMMKKKVLSKREDTIRVPSVVPPIQAPLVNLQNLLVTPEAHMSKETNKEILKESEAIFQ